MQYPKTSKRKANIFSIGILFIILGILIYTGWWWPGILVALWAFLGIRELLTQRLSDFFITTMIFLGIWAAYFLRIDWNLLTPLSFIIAGIYIILREYYYQDHTIQIEEEVKPYDPPERTEITIEENEK